MNVMPVDMSKIEKIEKEADTHSMIFSTVEHSRKVLFRKKFAELLIKECIQELRYIENEADRAYKAGEVSERQVFSGHDFAEILEERFGLK